MERRFARQEAFEVVGHYLGAAGFRFGRGPAYVRRQHDVVHGQEGMAGWQYLTTEMVKTGAAKVPAR